MVGYNQFFLVILLHELNKVVASDESEKRKCWKRARSKKLHFGRKIQEFSFEWATGP